MHANIQNEADVCSLTVCLSAAMRGYVHGQGFVKSSPPGLCQIASQAWARWEGLDQAVTTDEGQAKGPWKDVNGGFPNSKLYPKDRGERGEKGAEPPQPRRPRPDQSQKLNQLATQTRVTRLKKLNLDIQNCTSIHCMGILA